MGYKIDYLDGDVVRWSLTDDGATATRDGSYTPTLYVSVHGDQTLSDVEAAVREHPLTERTRIEERRISFRHDASPVLRIDVATLDGVKRLARTLGGWGNPGDHRLYNVDFSREFRYCLEAGIDPTPARKPTTTSLSVDELQLAHGPITELTLDGERLTSTPADLLERLSTSISETDPDVLLVNTSEVIPTLFEQAERFDVADFQLGRLPGFQRLAGQSTYTHYGMVGHSPARYNLPGRAIIDRSNTFMWNQTNLDGCLDLVSRSGRPLQELARSSIGTILTGIQIQEARRRNVLVPWRSWRHEQFKTMRQLRDADRGGFTFAPEVGLHEDVHELDFSSLYPNIIVSRNVSPERIRCDCHADRSDVPELGYSICEEDGFLPEVLRPLVEDRDAIKAELRETDDPERAAELKGRSNAIKWILVSCFGYQGFANAKFGRIECHEAINAFAREILLDAKAAFERHGWHVVHGIVDSVWVTPSEGESQTPLDDVADEISERVGIRLEYEARYDWIAFVPLRTGETGALTKYFGKKAIEATKASVGEDAYKFRGIECRQRSTPSFVEDAQKELIRVLDESRDPAVVCEHLQVHIDRLRRGAIDPSALAITNRVSKPLEAYSQYTRNVAALERANELGLARHPGQSISYVVADDETRSRERVRLVQEGPTTYDFEFYRMQLVRACESVLSPLGWRARRIERALSDTEDVTIQSFAAE
ncbi:type B DNA-directed DNA polymerase [Haloferax namakaokahaiae]|uniref:DNA-directed DNA polymerase n=1 Tax=Haloferax namakaokahaiae TaxID=1748331 RepID=A0ABD5ZDK2_9EURY